MYMRYLSASIRMKALLTRDASTLFDGKCADSRPRKRFLRLLEERYRMYMKLLSHFHLHWAPSTDKP